MTARKQKQAKKATGKQAKQPRPTNWWMVMLNVFQHERASFGLDSLCTQEVASWLSTTKENSSAEFLKIFVDAADTVKERHERAFPDYKYQPRKTKSSTTKAAMTGKTAVTGKTASTDTLRTVFHSSSSPSVSKSLTSSSSRRVKSTTTARKSASPPYSTSHRSGTPSGADSDSQPRSGEPVYHTTSLGRWTDPLSPSRRPVGGVFLTSSAHDLVARSYSSEPDSLPLVADDLEATNGAAGDDEDASEPADCDSPPSFEPLVLPSTPTLTPSSFVPVDSASSIVQPVVDADEVLPPYAPSLSPQPQTDFSSTTSTIQTSLPDYANTLDIMHEDPTLLGEFRPSSTAYTVSDDSDAVSTPLDTALYADSMEPELEPAPSPQSSPCIGYTELRLPPGIPIASDTYSPYDEPLEYMSSYGQSLYPASDFYESLFPGQQDARLYSNYVDGGDFAQSSGSSAQLWSY